MRLRVSCEGIAPRTRDYFLCTSTGIGRGLSISQLIFALNEELKCVACSPLYIAKSEYHLSLMKDDMLTICLCRFTFNSISQIDQDASITLASICEWKNSFVPVNHRLPTDIISLVPTHLPTQKDRFHPLLCVVICMESSSNMVHCGRSCFSKRVRSACHPP